MPNNISAYIRTARESLGMSRREFCELVGCTYRSLVAWELGQRSPKKTTMLWIDNIVHIERIKRYGSKI